MINSIELMNFLSHSNTKLDFSNGVTVFVGHNGAGKSSIIDGITFALFGTHSRKSNKGLIKKGENHCFAKIDFTVNGKKYRAIRKMDLKGSLTAQLLENKSNTWTPIIEGERRQFGESMTKKVESIIGLNYEKLKIASIVLQGELNAIIKAKPKEFKELINSIIGIDKLDRASEFMKIELKHFLEYIKKELGYDHTQIEFLKNKIIDLKEEKAKNEILKNRLLERKELIQNEIANLKHQVEGQTIKSEKIKQLETRKKELIKYAKNAIISLQKEITENEKKIHDCENCFMIIKDKTNVVNNLKLIESAIEDNNKKIRQCNIRLAAITEQEAIAKKLHIKNGKCPVCNSSVKKLNPIFQEEHLRKEKEEQEKILKIIENENQSFELKKNKLLEKLQNIKEAEATLRAYSVNTPAEIQRIKQEVVIKKTNIQHSHINENSQELVQYATIDAHTKSLYETIKSLEEETKNFDTNLFSNLKTKLDAKQSELNQVTLKVGAILENIRKNMEEEKSLSKTLEQLALVRKFYSDLEKIQDNVFNRDGPVALSLRSWVLNTISAKASDYLSRLNTKIQRIELSEKARDIKITCHNRTNSLDIESLSGGEQISVALSLRLAMAHLLGSSKLNFIILDEPTAHLDEERRRSLVTVLSQLSDISEQSNLEMQFIIITHDSEIFEDSNVEQIYRFESLNGRTVVNCL